MPTTITFPYGLCSKCADLTELLPIENYYRENGFSELEPMNRDSHMTQPLPENFDGLVSEAIQLKREVPSRSVAQIILILEMEGLVPPGILKRSTMQRYLYKSGFGKRMQS